MDATNLTLEITTVVSLISTIVGLLTFWFKMENKLNLQNQKIGHLEMQDKVMHTRIDSLKSEMVKNTDSLTEKYDSIYVGLNDVKVEMERNKGEILSAISEIKK